MNLHKLMYRCLTGLTLGAYRRLLRSTTFIAITGSGGKTTAKELAIALLSSRYQGSWTVGTFNTFWPLCRTLLGVRPRHRYCLMEMGAGGDVEQGGIKEFTRYFPPDIGVVLNVGLDHYTSFRGREAVASEKAAVASSLPRRGVAILNADDPYVAKMAGATRARVVWFGREPGADIQALESAAAWPDRLTLSLKADGVVHHLRTQLCGDTWVSSILAAWAIGRAMGLEPDEMCRAIEAFEPVEGRMSVVRHPDGVTWIRDDWKSPYWSIDHTVAFMRAARAPRKIMVFGTLSDTPGSTSPKYRSVARRALEVADLVVFVGKKAHYAVKVNAANIPDGLRMFATVREASTFLDSELRSGDLVLLKGSVRADHLQRLFLNREKPVQCWRVDCGLMKNCAHCPLLYQPSSPGG